MEKLHNDGIESELDAWLTFLGCDEPEYIMQLIEQYPYFKPMYDNLYSMCLNIERMIHMFSEELQILDRNTVKYMIDELQEELDAKSEELDAKSEELDAKSEELDVATSTIAELETLLQKYKDKYGNI